MGTVPERMRGGMVVQEWNRCKDRLVADASGYRSAETGQEQEITEGGQAHGD